MTKKTILSKKASIIYTVITFMFAIGGILYTKYETSKLNTLNNGDPITIAIIDSGLDLDKADSFKNNINYYNAIDNTDNVKDKSGHGSMIFNEIVNSRAVAKDEDSNLIVIKAFDEQGNSDIEIVNRALKYACDNNANLVNMSFNLTRTNDEFTKTVKDCYANGVVMLASVGDSPTNNSYYPAKFDEVISVSEMHEDSSAKIQVDMNSAQSCLKDTCTFIQTNSFATAIATSYFASEYNFSSSSTLLYDINHSNTFEIYPKYYLDVKYE